MKLMLNCWFRYLRSKELNKNHDKNICPSSFFEVLFTAKCWVTMLSTASPPTITKVDEISQHLSGLRQFENKLIQKSSLNLLQFVDGVWEPLCCCDLMPHCPKWGTDADQVLVEPLKLPVLLEPVQFCIVSHSSALRGEQYRSHNGRYIYAVPGRQCSSSSLMVGQYREWPQSRVSHGLFILCISY